MSDLKLLTTQQAAEQLGTSHMALLNWINRWPEYRPKIQMGGGAWVWTQEDIDRARIARQETKKLAGTNKKYRS